MPLVEELKKLVALEFCLNDCQTSNVLSILLRASTNTKEACHLNQLKTMIQLDTLSLFRNTEIRVKKPSGEEVLHMYSCWHMDRGAVLKEVHSSSINLTVKMWGKFNSPPFVASYAGVSGGLRAGK